MRLPEQITQLISERVHQQVTVHSDIRGFGDGLLFLTLLMAVEDEFEIEISDADAERILTVGHLIDHVGARVGEPV